MINAAQARTIAEESEASITAAVTRIGEKIEATARLGRRILDLEAAMNYDERYKPSKPLYHPAELTPWQRLVATRLEKEGFLVSIKEKTVKIGGGFKSMSDEPPTEELQPYIQVSW